ALHHPAHDLWTAFLGQELARRAAQHVLLFRKREIHGPRAGTRAPSGAACPALPKTRNPRTESKLWVESTRAAEAPASRLPDAPAAQARLPALTHFRRRSCSSSG